MRKKEELKDSDFVFGKEGRELAEAIDGLKKAIRMALFRSFVKIKKIFYHIFQAAL